MRMNKDWKAHWHTILQHIREGLLALYHHPVTVVVVLLLATVVWWFGKNGVATMKPYTGTQVVMNEPSIGQIQLMQMMEKNAEVCAYHVKQNQMVRIKRPARQTTVEKYEVAGDMALLPFSVVRGSAPTDRKKQCMIDEDTCYALFGSKNAVHNFVWVEDTCYEVSGIVKSSEKGVFTYTKDLSQTFDRMVIKGDEDALKAAIKVVASDQILSQTKYEDVNKTATYLTKLPIWMAGILLWFVLVFYKKKSIVKTIIVTAVIGLYLYVTGFHFYLPDRFIPERWSRLEFYPEMLQQLKDSVLHYLQMIQSSFEAQYFTSGIKTLFGTITLLLVELCVAIRLKKEK